MLTIEYSKPLGRRIIAVFAILIIITLLPLGGAGKKSPYNAMSRIISVLPLQTVASALDEKPEVLIERMGARGIKISSTNATISEIAAANGMGSQHVIRLLVD